jgi:RNase P subunit RPR2
MFAVGGLTCDACNAQVPIDAGSIRLEKRSRVHWTCSQCSSDTSQRIPMAGWSQMVSDMQLPYGSMVSHREVEMFAKMLPYLDDVFQTEVDA